MQENNSGFSDKYRVGAVAAITAVASLVGSRLLNYYPKAYFNLGLTLLYLLINSGIVFGIAWFSDRKLFGPKPKEKAPILNFYELLASYILIFVITVGGSFIIILEGELEAIIDIAINSMHYLVWTLVTLISLLAGKPGRVAASVITFLLLGFICLLALAFVAVLFIHF